MDNQPRLDLKHIIEVSKSEDSFREVGRQSFNLYEIGPWEFQSFARRDLEEGSERGRINALSNAKRAIECRVDELLTLLKLKCFSSLNRWGLRYKMQVLKTVGISAPDILMDYIVSKRNLLEHEYIRPKSLEETRHVADLAELFLSATDKYIEGGYISSATITYTEKGQRQKVSARVDRSIDYEDEYKLTFDLKNETLTVTNTQFECISEYNKKASELKSWKKVIGEQSFGTTAIRNYKEGDVRELMKRLLRMAD